MQKIAKPFSIRLHEPKMNRPGVIRQPISQRLNPGCPVSDQIYRLIIHHSRKKIKQTSKEFFERLQNDEEFAKEIGMKAKEKIDAGETDYKALWIPLGAEYGYELIAEELDGLNEKASESLSDEELGKVSAGCTPITGIIGFTCITYLIYNTVDKLG